MCLAAASGHSGLVSALTARGAVLEPLAASDAVRRNALHYAAAKGERVGQMPSRFPRWLGKAGTLLGRGGEGRRNALQYTRVC